jgi:hypothetical protein
VRKETIMAETGAQTGEAAATVLTTWVEHAAMGIELLAVVIIVAVILVATVLYVSRFLARRVDASTYRHYRQQVASALLLGLDVRFINTLPVSAALRHSRESGNPGDECHGDWMPACAGMTLYWRRTYETDI